MASRGSGVCTDSCSSRLQLYEKWAYIETNPSPCCGIMADSDGALYLNLIWHQHQPLYLDPELDQLQGPWVRTHGTKDYYDMASILQGYSDIHCTFNLTSSLLQQLRTYYVERLGPFVDSRKSRFDREAFL